MKELTINEVKAVSGAWIGPAIGGAVFGWAAGRFILDPAFNSIRDAYVDASRQEVEKYRRDPEGFAREHFSFYGDW